MKQNKIKIDWANVDHCGTCSYEVKKKPETPEAKPKRESGKYRCNFTKKEL